MHPVLFQLGPVTIYTYGVLVATGVLVGLWLARRQASRAGLDPDKVWNLGIYMVLAALVVAKLWLVVADWEYFRAHPREIFTLSTLQSGGVFYGGVIGALVVAVLYARRAKLRFVPLSDVYAAPLALGHAIGRLGCFAAGCCYGKPTAMPWGITFTNPMASFLVGTPLGVPLHPTELYESAAEFINFLFLIWLGRRQKFPGQMFGTYVILYGLERGTIEFFRGDPGRTLLYGGSFSLMQVVSIGLILFGAWMWWRGKDQPELKPALKPARR
jgi:phosphatidylglycerol:prolipoprotein diacylglycerol transferase